MVAWKNTNAIYQIYPRSFQDSDHDGVGDLRGITKRLGHIKGEPGSLGIDAIWISPIFLSPMADFGYDISDYEAIDPVFGTLHDFDELVAEANRRDINVMLDFVPNHTSDQHEWFKQAVSSKDSPYRDYYHFRDPAPDGGPPNNWLSVFGGSGWEFDQASGQYYLHSFLKEQPDLNWANPVVRQKMSDALRFWLNRGVRGFRFDAVRWMAIDEEYRDDKINPNYQPSDDPYAAHIHNRSRYGDNLDQYLRELTEVVDEYDNTLIVFEDYQDTALSADEQIRRMYNINAQVSVPMNLDFTQTELLPRNFAKSIARYQRGKDPSAHMVTCLGNHDKPRVASRYGEDNARLMAMLQLTTPGLPIIYYGEEIGMVDQEIPSDRVQDPFEKRVPGKGLGRDPERTPMRWDTSPNAGFSHAHETWLPMGDDIEQVNVAHQQADEMSFLSLYKRLIKLRSEYPALRLGRYDSLVVSKLLYAYDIHHGSDRLSVILNFSDVEQGILLSENTEILLEVKPGQTKIDRRFVFVEPGNGVVIRYR